MKPPNPGNSIEYCSAIADAVPYEMTYGNFAMPMVIDQHDTKRTDELVESVDPRIAGFYDRFGVILAKLGREINVDLGAYLLDFKWAAEETAFKAGLLAGVISVGSSNEVVNRYERGLAFSLSADHRLVKK
jgi:hypothetical protein